MQLNRGEIKRRAIKAASAVRARAGFEETYTYTPSTLCKNRVFVIDDATYNADVDESGMVFMCADLLFDAYILVAMPENPCEHDYELSEKAVDEIISDLAGQLSANNLRLVLPLKFTTRKVRNTDERNPSFTNYATAEFKIR